MPKAEASLTSRVIKGGTWVFVGMIAGRGLTMAKLVILARLLTPEDFGLFGIVMLAMAAIETFTQTGFDKALVQRRDDARGHLDTAWTVQIVRSFVLAGLLFASAPLVATFFDEPRAIPILRVLCIAQLLGGFRNIGMIYWLKDLEFNRRVVYDFAVSFASIAVGITLAYVQRNVWALVWSQIVGAAVGTVLGYVMHPYRPRLRWVPNQARQLFGYGKWLLVDSIVTFVAMNIDRILLGKLLGAVALGFYNMADRIGGLLPTEFMHLTNGVMMPAYAKVQDDRERLGRAFLQVFGAAVSIGAPVATFLVLSAPELVPAVLGRDWSPAIVPLQILAVGAFIRCVVGLTAPLFLGTGHPHIQFMKSLVRAVVTLSLVYPLTMRFGAAGTATATVLGVVALSPMFFMAMRIAHVPYKSLMASGMPGLLLAAGAGAGALAGKWVSGPPIFAFAVQVIAAGLIVLGTAWLLGRHDLGPLVMVTRYMNRTKPDSSPS